MFPLPCVRMSRNPARRAIKYPNGTDPMK